MTALTQTFRVLGQASFAGAVLMSSFAFSKPAAAISANVRFFQDYSWCDAQMLGKFWEITPDDAKFDAGVMNFVCRRASHHVCRLHHVLLQTAVGPLSRHKSSAHRRDEANEAGNPTQVDLTPSD